MSDDLKLSKKDFKIIKDLATHMYKNTHFPIRLNNSFESIEANEAANYCIVVSTISFLKSKGLIEEVPKFDLQERK